MAFSKYGGIDEETNFKTLAFIISVYVDASEMCNDVVFQLGQTGIGTAIATRKWSIKVRLKVRHQKWVFSSCDRKLSFLKDCHFFAHSVHIKLALPQIAQLSLNFCWKVENQ